MSMTPAQRVEILRACCCVAGADGETTENEMELLRRLADDIGVGQASLNAMIERAETDSEFYKQQFKILKDEPLESMEILVQVSMANGSLKEQEYKVLTGLGDLLDINETDFKTIVERTHDRTEHPD